MTNRKNMLYNVLKESTFENKEIIYKKVRDLIFDDFIQYELKHTNIDGRGTDWSDNNNRYKKVLKLWKKH